MHKLNIFVLFMKTIILNYYIMILEWIEILYSVEKEDWLHVSTSYSIVSIYTWWIDKEDCIT
jgi:hypothetical protein